MASTYSSALRLELMSTGDQSGTWGDTTNTNLGTLLEQSITGVLSVAQGDVLNLTLTANNGASDQARNAVINLTGALTAARNVVVPTANKLYLIKNSTTGGFAITVKTSAGTGVTVPATTARWVYCDGTNVVDGISGPWAPSADDAQALGLSGTAWSDLFLASGAVINFGNSDVNITHSTDRLVFTGATAGYAFSGAGGIAPLANDGGPIGASGTAWSDLFLASGGVINFNAGDVTLTHSLDTLTVAGGVLAVPNGTAIAPSVTFSGDPNTGIYSSAADVLGFAAGGAERFLIGTTNSVSLNAFRVPDGAVTAPAVTFAGAPTSGMFFTTGIAFTVDGATVGLRLQPDGDLECIGVYNKTTAVAASVALDTNGVMYRSTSARKYKKDFQPITDEQVTAWLSISGFTYAPVDDDSGRRFFGFAADDAAAAGLNELVSFGKDGEVEGYEYGRDMAIAQKVINGLLQQVESLTTRLDALEQKSK